MHMDTSHHLQLGPLVLKFDLLVGVPHSWDELKCAEIMEPGGQSVMITLGLLMPMYFAKLWDLIELCVFRTILVNLALELVTVVARLNLYAFHLILLSDQIYSFPSLGPIWLDNLNCPASAEIIEDCSHPGWGVHNCNHRDDADVFCNPGR